MKNKLMISGLMAFVLFFSFSCKVNKELSSQHKEEIKAEIQAIENQLALAYNNRSAEGLSYYAVDAISYFAGQEPIMGKEAILENLKNEILDFPEGAKLSFETVEIYISDNGEHVIEIGAHQLEDSNGKVFQRGHYVSFFAKVDGKYVCIRDMANTAQVEN